MLLGSSFCNSRSEEGDATSPGDDKVHGKKQHGQVQGNDHLSIPTITVPGLNCKTSS